MKTLLNQTINSSSEVTYGSLIICIFVIIAILAGVILKVKYSKA